MTVVATQRLLSFELGGIERGEEEEFFGKDKGSNNNNLVKRRLKGEGFLEKRRKMKKFLLIF